MATLFEMGRPETGGLKPNEAQRRAITHGDGPLLVIAGAGTGKTRVITERIGHLLESHPSLLGENILGLTFTKKAAGEMKTRVVRAVGERAKDVMLATFHSFCEILLKEADPNRIPLESVDGVFEQNLALAKALFWSAVCEAAIVGEHLIDAARRSSAASASAVRSSSAPRTVSGEAS